MSVEVFSDVEAFRHARQEGLAGDHRVHERRHRQLRSHHDVDGPEFAGLDTPLDDPGHQPVAARHYLRVVEPG